MSIGIGSTTTTSPLASLDATQPTATRASRTSSMPPAATATISPRAELMSKLQELAQKDPAKFKEVASSIASELKDAASSATGDRAQALGKLADAFSQAASSGDMSSLKPSGHGHHHHHHGGGAKSSTDGATSSVFSTALAQVDDALSVGSSPT